MREIEILLGLPDGERVPLGQRGQLPRRRCSEPTARRRRRYRRVQARLADRPSLREASSSGSHRTPIQGSIAGAAATTRHGARLREAYLGDAPRRGRAGDARGARAGAHRGDGKRLEERAAQEIASARAFLLGEDEAPDRARGRRASARRSSSSRATASCRCSRGRARSSTPRRRSSRRSSSSASATRAWSSA